VVTRIFRCLARARNQRTPALQAIGVLSRASPWFGFEVFAPPGFRRNPRWADLDHVGISLFSRLLGPTLRHARSSAQERGCLLGGQKGRHTATITWPALLVSAGRAKACPSSLDCGDVAWNLGPGGNGDWSGYLDRTKMRDRDGSKREPRTTLLLYVTSHASVHVICPLVDRCVLVCCVFVQLRLRASPYG